MNFKKLLKILGKIMILEGALMLIPLIVAFCYKEDFVHKLAFIIPIVVLLSSGFSLQLLKPKRNNLYQKEGFALVALVWVVMALFGAIPFVINKDIPNYIDALFETISGFTTTGASIVSDVTTLSHSTLFWRSFTHWIGGMGILVFVLIFIPEGDEGSSLHLLKAESSGPTVGKIVSKMKVTTRILYSIYLGMTALEFIILLCAGPIKGFESDHVFISLVATFGCAGTGGFGFIPGSIELFSPFAQYTIATFLLLFGINFTLYYLLLIGKFKEVFKNRELRTYLLIVVASIGLIFTTLITKANQLAHVYSTEEAFRHSYFQVASIMTTTGYSTTDFNLWPVFAKTILLILMFTGAMAGSTSGGFKLSRVIICVKGIGRNIRKLINPRYVPKTKMEGKQLEESVINDVFALCTIYFFIVLSTILVLSLDPVNGTMVQIASDSSVGTYVAEHGFTTNFTAAISAISNIGPGFDAVGAYSSFAAYSGFSKVFLSFVMLILFSPKTWKK